MPAFLNLLRFFSRFGLLNDDSKLMRNYFADYSNPIGRAASMSETVCNGFEPQTYLKDRCKHCFRVRSKHEDSTAATLAPVLTTVLPVPSTAATSPTTSVQKKERRKSWREKAQNPDEGPEQDDAGDGASVASFKSANSKGGLSSAKSLESVTSASNFDTRSMVTAVSSSIEYDDRAMTPTSAEPDDVRSLKQEITRLQDQIASLKEERQRWTLRKEKRDTESEESLMEMLEEKLLEAENCIQDYRDENTVLKCELRELQESGQTYSGTGDTPLEEKLKAAEQLCDEMLTENEALKAENRDLQQEIEEMQDQYREEEIEEFRELQRELEQNAKNCRILQFKLRKSERLRDEAEAERVSAEERLRSILHLKEGDEDGLTTSQMNAARVRELESELRIAKEVSVRLHVELESTEEKRCKFEDEVFYLNEKVRELQTHRKWREARQEREKRLSAELPLALAPIISESTPKEMRDLLERENDLKEQLKYAEDDQKRTRARLHDLENENEELLHKLANLTVSGKLGGRQRPPMTRSASEGNTHLQLELATSEVEHLTAQVSKLEQKNANLTKKLLDIEIDTRKSQEGKMNGHGNSDYEKDISKLMWRITELEKNNAELLSQQKKQLESKPPSGQNQEQKVKSLEAEVAEMKQLLGKTDNQKLIAMATKAELLNNQLMIANDRINALHKRAVRESKAEGGYTDSLKQRCDNLEKQISEAKAVSAFTTPVVAGEDNALASVAEIEQCCVVLASVETQTSRICKQIEKMDNAQKDERRRSLTKDSSATIIAELANVMGELKSVHSLLEAHKLNNPSYVRRSPDKDELAKCRQCEEKEAFIESQREDIIFYKKKNKELTNQLLQTEDRWSVEMEKQRQTYETEIKNLQSKVTDALRQLKEQQHILESKSASLTEKVKMIQEKDAKCEKLANEVKEKQKMIQDIEKEQKNLKEFETRYRKLESLYNQEKEKSTADRAKTKGEMALMKKRCDETHQDLDKLREAHQRREILWNSEREKLEKSIYSLRERLGKDDDGREQSTSVSLPGPAVSYTYRAKTSEASMADLQNTIMALRKKIVALEEKVCELRLANEELTSELSTTKQNWDRDKENMQHKLRQDEKIRSVEFEALQEKFASRMNIMENTNKSLHTQLVQTRRERDHHKEAVNNYEKRIEEERKRMEMEEKHYANLVAKSTTMEKKLKEFEDEIDRLKRELKLTKEGHSADKKLWIIEKTHMNSKSDNSTVSSSDDDKDVRITENALKAAESVQKQYVEYQRFYDREVDRLKSKIKELTNDAFTKEFEHERTVKQLREQIKVLEIDQRNLIQAKDMQASAREACQAEQERLQQAVQLAEVQKLTRKYKVSAAIEQLKMLIDGTEKDVDGTIRGVVGQLGSVRDDDSQTLYSPTESSGIYDVEQPSDTVSQSSMSIKSSPFPVNSATSRWTNHSNTITPNRSFSIESNATWEPRSHSPVKKLTTYPDPPPNFILNTDKTVEYDKDGRLHYVPKSIARSASYDRHGLENNGGLAPPPAKPNATLTDDEESCAVTMVHSRTSSTGTNILYKIRREELAKGSQPTVRQMAKAFDMMDSKPKRGLFSIRKSRSVETTEAARKIHESSKNALVPGVPTSVLHRNTTSMSQIDDRILPTSSSSPAAYTTLPRGGRNPFKNMGTKIVERVRRSLSRTSVNRRSEDDESLHERNSMNTAKIVATREAVPATPVKTKTKTKKTTRKQPAAPTSPPPSTPPDRKLKSTVISSA